MGLKLEACRANSRKYRSAFWIGLKQAEVIKTTFFTALFPSPRFGNSFTCAVCTIETENYPEPCNFDDEDKDQSQPSLQVSIYTVYTLQSHGTYQFTTYYQLLQL